MYEWKTLAVRKEADAITKTLNDMAADGWVRDDAPWEYTTHKEGDDWVHEVLITFVREKALESAPVTVPDDAEAPTDATPADAMLYHVDAAYRVLSRLSTTQDPRTTQARRLLDNTLQDLRGAILNSAQEGRF